MVNLQQLMEGPGALARCLRRARALFLKSGSDNKAEAWTLGGSCRLAIAQESEGVGIQNTLTSVVNGLLASKVVLAGSYHLTTGGPIENVLMSVCSAGMRQWLLKDEECAAQEILRTEQPPTPEA
jgi:hypothetical protein